MGFYLTQVSDINGNSPFYDTLLTGPRWAFGAKSYRVVYMRDVNEFSLNGNEVSHVIKMDSHSQYIEIAKRIIGIILVLLVIPTVVGLILKSQDQKAKENYVWLESSLEQKPVLIKENLRKAPPLLPISDWSVSEEARSKQVILNRLERLWPRNAMPQSVRANIREICNTVWDGSFTNLLQDPEKAGNFLKNSLCNICSSLERSSRTDAEKEEILRQLSDVAGRCHPTWVEVVGKLLRRILSASCEREEEDRFLSFVQRCKEEIALEGVQKRNPSQWHGLNNVRKQIGAEFGLDLSFGQYDRYATLEHMSSSNSLRRDMLCELHPLRLVQGVANAIRSEMIARGKDGFVDGMDELFAKAAYKFRESFSDSSLWDLDFMDVDDLINFYKKYFYTCKGRKSNGVEAFELRDTAVLWIMVVLGIIEVPSISSKSTIGDIYRDEIPKVLQTVVT